MVLFTQSPLVLQSSVLKSKDIHCSILVRDFLLYFDSFFPFYTCDFQLGLVIDLTNTTRYYSVLDLKKEGIKHVKVCIGQLCLLIQGFLAVLLKLWYLFLVLIIVTSFMCCLDSMQGARFCTRQFICESVCP